MASPLLSKVWEDWPLKFLANKLVEAKRAQDYPGRLSGSTFGLVVNGIMNKGHAQLAALKILRLLELPLETEEKRINYSKTCKKIKIMEKFIECHWELKYLLFDFTAN